jgi:predicted nucleotidyltransferase
MKDRVLAELERIENEHQIRVLLAVESGSRAWGFASPDSDYDVRFIYVHDRDWYLSVFEQRDVIEEMLPGDLDVNGWDLRKALRLFSKCNLALNEWLLSPQTYSESREFRAQLIELIPGFFNPTAAIHHYRSTAVRSFEDNYVDGRIKIKKLFYVLRPLLACRWIEKTVSQPPTEFASLIATDWVSDDEKQWIRELSRQKAESQEKELIALDPSRVAAICAELERYAQAHSLVPAREKQGGDLDRVLRTCVNAG